MMLRTAILLTLICSLSLNVYFYLTIKAKGIGLTTQTHSAASFISESSTGQLSKTNLSTNKLNVNGINNSPLSTKGSSNDNQPQDLIGVIKKSITSKDYVTASFLINTLETKSTDENTTKNDLTQLRTFWLDSITSLIKEGLFLDAESSINAYLEFKQDDLEFLYLQVELYLQQKQFLVAINYAYEVQYHVFDEVKKQHVLDTARGIVKQQIDTLVNKTLWFELSEFVEHIALIDPDDANLQWFNVLAQFHLGEFEYARVNIEPLLNQPNYKIKAQALLTDIEVALRKPESIPLNRQGEHFIVDAMINDNIDVSLMLDTGASISLLSESAFESVTRYSQATFMKEIKLNTAGGQVTANIYKVAEFSIQGYVLTDFIFAISPFVSEHNDGLLGMNFLGAFDFHIDQKNSLLVLKNK